MLRKGDVISNLQIKEQQILREKDQSSVYEIPIVAKTVKRFGLLFQGHRSMTAMVLELVRLVFIWILPDRKGYKNRFKKREESDRSKRAEERFLAKCRMK